jgi:hypothetical protein
LDESVDLGVEVGVDGRVNEGRDVGVDVGVDEGLNVKVDERLNVGMDERVDVGGDGGVLPAPHILHVVVSDWGYNCVGYTNPGFDTPFIDSLAASGIRLNHFVTDPVRRYSSCDKKTSDRWPHALNNTVYRLVSDYVNSCGVVLGGVLVS